MRKKVSRDKNIKIYKERPERPCSLCHSPAPPFSALPHNTHLKKYYHLQVQAYHYRAINNLIYDPYSSQAIQTVQMQKLIHCQQSIKQYYSFARTVATIKKVITHRAEKDFYGWVDFQPSNFIITNTYYLRRKQLFQTGRQMEKYLKTTSDMQSTGSGDGQVRQYIRERIKKQLDQHRLVLPNETNSTIDMQRLTKNISIMVEKIADLSAIRPLHPKAKGRNSITSINKFSSIKGIQSQPELFRFSNFRQISVIRQTTEVQQMVQPSNYPQSYGLETIKPKQSRSKKVNKLGIRSIDKLATDEIKVYAETPSPHMIHRFDYLEKDEGNWRRDKNRNGKATPSSPCSHSASLNSKSKSRKKNRSSRKR